MRSRLAEAGGASRYPILEIFAACCASEEKLRAKSRAQSATEKIFLFIVLPHASRVPPTAHAYLITLSARYSTDCGIVTPICLAALRLTMSSKFFGCSTGRSAGLAPFKILSTKVAARRYKSV